MLHQKTTCIQNEKEFLLYVTPNRERKAAIVVSNKIGKAFIERLTFDTFEIEDLHIDFINNKCSFSYNENHETQVTSSIQNILLGFFIQYHEQSIAFFTYRKKK